MTDTITPDTDNLDDFNDLFNGKATAEPEVKEVEAVTDGPVPEDDSLAPDVTDPEENEEADPDPEEDKQLLVPKKKTVQERINELTAARRDAERREAELLRKIEALEQNGKTKEPEVQAPVAVVGEPTPDDLLEDGEAKYPLGEYDPNYIRDLTKFTIEAENKAHKESLQQTEAQQRQQAEREALTTSWQERVTEVQERIPDFVEKGQDLEATFTTLDPEYGDYLATTIMGLDNGPDVLYYLANNLEEAQLIANAGPLKAAIALGGLDRILAKSEAAPPPKVSNAPEPPTKATSRGTNSRSRTAADTEDLDAFAQEFFKRK